jgi:hypothetical protein
MAPSSPADEEWSDSDQIMSDSSQVMSDPVEPQLPTQLNLPAVEDGSSILTIALGSDTGSIFQPTPTSGTCHTDEYSPITAADKADLVIDQAQLDVDYARKILDGLPIEQGGWCELVTHQPTKRGGYIQVSYGGANKFASLQEVVLWADGKVLLSRGDQCSHRCHSPRCRVVGHVISESAVENNARKGCLVWIKCHHCDKYILVCMHDPCCIKTVPGFKTLEDFLTNGVCRFLLEETRQQANDNAMMASAGGESDEY